MAVENRCQHQRLVQQYIDPLLVGLNPNDAVLRKRPTCIRKQTYALQHILDDHGFEDIQLHRNVNQPNPRSPLYYHTSNWPLAPATLTAVWLPIT
jgi:hypothetical protein